MIARTPITLLVLLVVLLIAAWYGWTRISEPLPDPFAKAPTCVTEQISDGGTLSRRQVVVNVYNAGSRDDLASKTLHDLTERGFARGTAENAPERLQVQFVLILDADPDAAAVTLLKQQFKGKVEVRDQPDLGDEGVDVVVGNGYHGLKKQAPTQVTVKSAQEVCVPETTKPTKKRPGNA